ncbi:hypothetical protein NEOLEDRAFT_1137381 [Neolentinus lepideus HHB14362 ss-1]|uniref:Uncharacterized protein n=1 Tax=Neolentinus lepideus HHB14362 ss-1 TaxID=1314782 RepID=A0A165QT06_9AGAM|nr:hypothetical protein NEOLEDRAFT_1137381 [Neolentinus lepideus HHB14362 ss-1]
MVSQGGTVEKGRPPHCVSARHLAPHARCCLAAFASGSGNSQIPADVGEMLTSERFVRLGKLSTENRD